MGGWIPFLRSSDAMIKEAKISSVVSLFPLPQYVIVLEDMEKTRLVPIWIGVSEGNAIALEMQGEKFPRPLTHDLLVNLVKALGGQFEKVVISDLKENSYYALIYIRQGERTFEIDARPSDSLAISVRVQCPVYIDEKVLRKCPPLSSGPISKEDVEKFKEDLKNMAPEEFFKRLKEAPPAATDTGFESFGNEEEDEGDEDDQEDDNERENQ